MPNGARSTLTQFLVEERHRVPVVTGDLCALITRVSLACKRLSRKLAYGELSTFLNGTAADGLQTKGSQTLRELSHQLFSGVNQGPMRRADVVPLPLEDMDALPPCFASGPYWLSFDPIDCLSNFGVNVAVGSIFSILHATTSRPNGNPENFLQPGCNQVCAGYAIYGPSTMLVLTLGHGTVGFTLEPESGEWVLSQPNLQIPHTTRAFAVNDSHSRYWELPIKRDVEECMVGLAGPRQSDFSVRKSDSLVAELHRILIRGGAFISARNLKEPDKLGQLSLLYQANPIAYLIEQAGGIASTGHERVMNLQPEFLHQQVDLIFGSSEEVLRIESYHRDGLNETYTSPLFGKRGLFAATS